MTSYYTLKNFNMLAYIFFVTVTRPSIKTSLGFVNPNGPELPETLKVQEEGQMARTYIFFYLTGPTAISAPYGPPF